MEWKLLSVFIFLHLLVITPEFVTATYGGWYYGGRRRPFRDGYGEGYRRRFYGNRRRFGGGGGRAFRTGVLFGILASNFGKKRAADEEVAVTRNDNIEAALSYWDLAFEQDSDECLAETLCEIMADYEKKDSGELVKLLTVIYDSKIMSLYSDKHKEAFALLRAIRMGKDLKSKSICQRMYFACKTDVEQRKKDLEEDFAEQIQ